MKDNSRLIILLLLVTVISILSPINSMAQKKVVWHATAGVGISAMRDFSYGIDEISYNFTDLNSDASVSYRLKSRPDYLINAGVGVSGTFREQGVLGWDAGLNIRTGGFRLTTELLELQGEFDSPIAELLPEFGRTESFRYWGFHVPLSLNYIPFEVVGFTIGADLYYQITSDPSASEPDQIPGGRLGRHMGLASMNTPDYRHPFQIGGHLGVYVPISERIRLDAQVFTDLSPRLTVGRGNADDWKFREMGLMLNVRYSLGW